MEIQALLNSATNLVLIMYPAHHSVCRSLALLLHRQLSTVGRGSNLYFELSIDYEKALAFRKANGDYLRKGQWKDLQVEVYII